MNEEEDRLDWEDLPDDVRDAAQILGYDQTIWDSNRDLDIFDTDWEQLTTEEREAAKELGYTKSSWNGVCVEDEIEAGASDVTGTRAVGTVNKPKPNKNQIAAKAKEKKLKGEFDMIDKDKSGFIDKGDLKKMLGKWIPEAYVVKAISYVDKNKDGKLSFQEYKAIRLQIDKALPMFKSQLKKISSQTSGGKK